MKKLLLLFVVMLGLVGCKSTKSITEKNDNRLDKFAVVDKENIDANQKSRAYSFGKRVLETCNTSKFKAFSEKEAVESVRKNTTVERLSATCQKMKQRYGDFKDIKLQEVLYNEKSQLTLYRYKIDFQRKHTQKELRVEMNSDNQVTSIKTVDWQEQFSK